MPPAAPPDQSDADDDAGGASEPEPQLPPEERQRAANDPSLPDPDEGESASPAKPAAGAPPRKKDGPRATPAPAKKDGPRATPANAGTGKAVARPDAFRLPPGVKLDRSIRPLSATGASRAAKVKALIAIAERKLGVKWIWGHNEDRGQVGFDCSNFTSYVFHHALGYKMSTASKSQYFKVGWRRSGGEMKPGDLIVFSGKTPHAHVGIYVGNGKMIQCGGGLGKVGYMPVKTGYWSRHISAIKRMF
jgi:cell wall-associated NlpC family hydrolase